VPLAVTYFGQERARGRASASESDLAKAGYRPQSAHPFATNSEHRGRRLWAEEKAPARPYGRHFRADPASRLRALTLIHWLSLHMMVEMHINRHCSHGTKQYSTKQA